jgi:hypothetical protein
LAAIHADVDASIQAEGAFVINKLVGIFVARFTFEGSS